MESRVARLKRKEMEQFKTQLQSIWDDIDKSTFETAHRELQNLAKKLRSENNGEDTEKKVEHSPSIGEEKPKTPAKVRSDSIFNSYGLEEPRQTGPSQVKVGEITGHGQHQFTPMLSNHNVAGYS